MAPNSDPNILKVQELLKIQENCLGIRHAPIASLRQIKKRLGWRTLCERILFINTGYPLSSSA
jgi:hypothetical protein